MALVRTLGAALVASWLWRSVEAFDDCDNPEYSVFSQAGCPDSSWRFNARYSKCYKFTQESATWLNCAEDVCHPGSLVQIRDQAHNDEMFSMIRGQEWAWIGLYQQPYSEHAGAGWDSWVNGCSAEQYENWHSGPDDWCGLNEACAFMKRGDYHGYDIGKGWQDAGCQNEWRCLCEYPSQGPKISYETREFLLEEGEGSAECEIGFLVAILSTVFGCCCSCCCICGICGYFFYRRSERQRQWQQQQMSGSPYGISTMPAQPVTAQPVMAQPVMGQPVMGRISGETFEGTPSSNPVTPSPSAVVNPGRPIQAVIVRQ